MNKFRIIILVFLYLGIFQANLFTEISSRIEGTVEAKETGEKLTHARVVLFCCECSPLIVDRCCEIMRVETGDNGFFKFDDLQTGSYFICIYRDGYANYGAVWEWKKKEHSPVSGLRCISGKTASDFETFFLNEGQIKHFKFKLEREAIIEVHVTRKTFSGMEQLDNDEFSVLVDLDNTNFTQGDGVLAEPLDNLIHRFPGFSGGTQVQVRIFPPGWPIIDYDVQLEKGKVEVINPVLDFTTGQVVYGVIKKKGTGEPLLKAYISVGKNYGEAIVTYSNDKGEYWVGGLEPGENVIYVDPQKLNKAVFEIEINSNQRVKFDIEI